MHAQHLCLRFDLSLVKTFREAIDSRAAVRRACLVSRSSSPVFVRVCKRISNDATPIYQPRGFIRHALIVALQMAGSW